MWGHAAPGYEPVITEFAGNFSGRGDVGAAFAAVSDAGTLVDLWGGVAKPGVPWTANTVCPIHSGSKGLVAACMLLLLDRGLIELDAPVASYWPEFAQSGKANLSVRHVLTHQAGLPVVEGLVTLDDALCAKDMAERLARQRPLTEPGSVVTYHALTFGWLCAELVRLVDGRTVGELFREEIGDPLSLDAWIGVPEELSHRVAKMELGDGFTLEQGYESGSSLWSWVAAHNLDNPRRFVRGHLAANNPKWQRAQVPASNAIASARSLSHFYAWLAAPDQSSAVRLGADSADRAHRRLCRAVDPVSGDELSYSVGFAVQTRDRPFGADPRAFGHNGIGGSVHCAWPSRGIGLSYVTNLMGPAQQGGSDDRARALLERLWHCARQAQHAR